MLSKDKVVVFVATTNGERARRFYEGVLGLNVVSDDAFALVCDVGGTSLRIQKVTSLRAQIFTVLGWEVQDIAATIAGLTKRGVTFDRFDGMDQDERGVWRSPSGARVAWFKDPDGNTVSLTQT